MTAVDYPAPAAVPPAVADAVPADRPLRRWALRGVLWTGLVLAFVDTAAREGLPTDRVVLLGWLLAGLAVHALTDGWRRGVRLLVDWLPLRTAERMVGRNVRRPAPATVPA